MSDGEAGIGKTHLLNEFAKKAKATSAFVLAGGCIPLGGAGVPYGPLTEALRLLVRQNGLSWAPQLAGPAWSELAGLITDFTDDGPPSGRSLSGRRSVMCVLSFRELATWQRPWCPRLPTSARSSEHGRTRPKSQKVKSFWTAFSAELLIMCRRLVDCPRWERWRISPTWRDY
jgi:hypothetical protein